MTTYEPGTVVDAFVTTRQRRHRAVRVAHRHYPWQLLDGIDPSGLDPVSENAVTDVRSLVVIDPESADDADRLIGLFWDNVNETELDDPAAMQAALREWGNPTPPKPEEPTGLGAVVEDTDGLRWIKARDTEPDVVTWRSWPVGMWKHYSDIAAVRVLSEGVTP